MKEIARLHFSVEDQLGVGQSTNFTILQMSPDRSTLSPDVEPHEEPLSVEDIPLPSETNGTLKVKDEMSTMLASLMVNMEASFPPPTPPMTPLLPPPPLPPLLAKLLATEFLANHGEHQSNLAFSPSSPNFHSPLGLPPVHGLNYLPVVQPMMPMGPSPLFIHNFFQFGLGSNSAARSLLPFSNDFDSLASERLASTNFVPFYSTNLFGENSLVYPITSVSNPSHVELSENFIKSVKPMSMDHNCVSRFKIGPTGPDCN